MYTNKLLKTTCVGILGLTMGMGLAACSSTESSTTPSTTVAQDPTASWVTGEADDGTTMAIDQATDLTDGQKLEIKITQADPDMGYYLAVCAEEKTGVVPNCMGAHGDTETQQWISNKNEEGAIPEDGTVETSITVHPAGEDTNGQTLDCRSTQCVLKLFGDHSNGFIDVVNIPVTYAE